MKSKLVAAALVASLMIAAQSFAGTLSITQASPVRLGLCRILTLAGNIVNDLAVNASPGVSIGAMQILLNLTTGSIYNNSLGQTPRRAPRLLAHFRGLHTIRLLPMAARWTRADRPRLSLVHPTSSVVRACAAVFGSTVWDAVWGPFLGQATLA